MDGRELYSIFKGIRLHFSNPKYDYPTFGPMKVYDSEMVKNYTIANGLSRYFTRESLEHRLIALYKHKAVWINEINSPEAKKAELKHNGILETLSHHFEQDLIKITDEMTIKDALRVDSGISLPYICRMLLASNILIETYCILDMLVPFNNKVGEMLWQSDKLRVEKYKAFFKPDLSRMAKIARPYFSE